MVMAPRTAPATSRSDVTSKRSSERLPQKDVYQSSTRSGGPPCSTRSYEALIPARRKLGSVSTLKWRVASSLGYPRIASAAGFAAATSPVASTTTIPTGACSTSS